MSTIKSTTVTMSSTSSRDMSGGTQQTPGPSDPSHITLEPMSVTMTPSGLAAVIRSSPAQIQNPPGIVQIRQIRTQGASPFKTTGISHAQPGSTLLTLNHRQVPQNLTILPGRPTVVTSNFTGRGATLHLTGTGTRPVPVVTSGTPGSITVTPISGTNIVSGLRFTTAPGSPQLTGLPAGTGTWTSGPPTLRPAIQVRPIRPEAGKIYLNQSNVVQHVTQLQVVSSSPSQNQISLKPSTSVNIRGTLHQTVQGQGTSGPTPIPLAPFTIRASTIARPGLTSLVSMAPTSQVQKVITQPAHGPPIIVNNPNVGGTIQRVSGAGTITSNLQTRVPVAFTLAKGTTLTPTSSSITSTNPPTLVGLQHSSTTTPGGNIAVMSSSLPAGATAKLYPLNRDVSTSLVETYITQGHVQTSQSTISSPPTLNVRTSIGLPISRTTTIVTGTPIKGTTSSTGGPTTGPIVQVGTINLPQSYILPQVRPITLDHTKKINSGSGPPPGSSATTNLILAAAPTTIGQQITFPITPVSGTHYGTHPISISKPHLGGTGVSGPGSVLIAPPHLTISPHITLGPPQTQGLAPPSTSSGTVILPPCTSTISTLNPNIIGTTSTQICATSTSLAPSTTCTPTTSTPSASPKSNLSPRPSILRKRDALILEPTPTSAPQPSPLRAQRNLSVNFGNPTSNPPTVLISPANKENSSNSISTFISTIVTSNPSTIIQGSSSSSGQNVIGTLGTHGPGPPVPISLSTSCPLTFLKANEPFLPPHEESDGSNSSSGSTTLSTTSETAGAELINLQDDHPHPPILPSPITQPHLPPTIVVSRSAHMGTSSLPPVININTSHNGILIRSSVPNSYGNLSGTNVSTSAPHSHPHPPIHTVPQPQPRRSGGAGGRGGASGAGRRGGGGGDKDKSPRKKPRKQQLNASDYLEASEVSFIPTKRYKKGAGTGTAPTPAKQTIKSEDDRASDSVPSAGPVQKEGRIAGHGPPASMSSSSVLTPHNLNKSTVGRGRTRANSLVIYNLTKPRVPLVLQSELPANTRYNHFERYSDVKSKDERRPTINDLANQRNVDQKISGWKLRHLSGQLEEVIANESGVVTTFVELLGQMDTKFGAGGSLGGSNRDLSRIEDLLKGNIQRCRVIRDQMTESKTQVFKVLDHQPRVSEVIHKYMSRRVATNSNNRPTISPLPSKQKPSLRNYDKY